MRKLPKEAALLRPTIQLNWANEVRYLTFDIDREYAGIAWEDANLPVPNLVISNPENGHAHLIYELADPVWLPKKDDDRPGEAPPVRYLKAIRRAMGKALGADTHYAGILTKNPFHSSWRVSSGSVRPYTMGQLCRHLELTVDRAADLRDNPEGRNSTLFDSGRFWAYREKAHYPTLGSFYSAIRDELERLNGQFIIPLNLREVDGIAKSISGWVWYSYTGSGKNAVRRGIMGLDSSEPLAKRQKRGQQFTSETRVNKTLSRIRCAIRFLKDKALKLTKSAIALQSGIHRNTIRVYWLRVVEELVGSVAVEGDSEGLRPESWVETPVASEVAALPTYPDAHPFYPMQSNLCITDDDLVNIEMQSVRYGICECHKSIPLIERKRIGQRFTAQMRSGRTIAKIRQAIITLLTNGERVTKAAVARISGLHRNTVSGQWKNLNCTETIDPHPDVSDNVWERNRQKAAYARLKQYRKDGRVGVNHRIGENLRNRLRKSLKGATKTGSVIRDLGCTVIELREHLETRFLEGMSWENYGQQWEIDHMMPLSAFNLSSREEFLRACHYSNLQPLWRVDNRRKSNKMQGNNEQRATERTVGCFSTA